MLRGEERMAVAMLKHSKTQVHSRALSLRDTLWLLMWGKDQSLNLLSTNTSGHVAQVETKAWVLLLNAFSHLMQLTRQDIKSFTLNFFPLEPSFKCEVAKIIAPETIFSFFKVSFREVGVTTKEVNRTFALVFFSSFLSPSGPLSASCSPTLSDKS